MQRATRGAGFLEPLLARLRGARANALIPADRRSGTILDIGCGAFPAFLASTRFARKFAVDRQYESSLPAGLPPDINAGFFDANADRALPFADASADVVTMLAVFEHILPRRLPFLLTDIFRVLRPGGSFVMTTPSSAAAPVLRFLSRLGAISPEEFEEHQDHYSRERVREVFRQTPFADHHVRVGLFEFGMNVWVRATKP